MLKSGFVFPRMFVLGLLLMLVAGPTTQAQSTTDGAIAGTVTDSTGAAVASAHVTVRNNGTNLEQTSVTDESGYFRVGKLQPALYMIKVEASGMAPYTVESV